MHHSGLTTAPHPLRGVTAPHRFRLKSAALLATALLLTACGDRPRDTGAAESAPDSVLFLAEAFESERVPADNIDSPSVWHGPEGQHWVITTAKDADALVVHDAATGELVRRVGGEGTEAGMLQRPNGIAVIDDLALVVERDNARVQVFRLPEFESLGFVGEDLFKFPYGIAALSSGTDQYDIFITDNYEDPGEQIPPDSMLGERVQQFRLSIEDGRVVAEHVRAIGPTSGEGRLRVVESIFVDPENERLLIAEEEEGRSHIKVFTLDGEFTGDMIDQRHFPNEAEGIALYACDDGDGYWISTDQSEETNTFHIFDRRSLQHVGSFSGETTRNTDGIALTQHGFGPFPAGAMYAVHDDQSITAFSWTEIAEGLGLRSDCGPGGARVP